MFRKILVATDGSDHATKAVELAADIAAKCQAELLILNVRKPGRLPEEMRRMAEVEHLVEPTPNGNWNVADVSSGLAAAMARDEARERAISEAYWKLGEQICEHARLSAERKGAPTVHSRVENGDPADRILAVATADGCDLIVLGSRGLSDLKGLLIGSVSHKVSQLCKCTCVTVK